MLGGKVNILTHTHQDINFVVNNVSQFLSNPSRDHMDAMNPILKYLKKDPRKGLMFKKTINHS